MVGVIKTSLQFGLIAATLVVTAWANLARGDSVDAGEMLMRMNAAFTEENYDGVFTYVSGDEMASLRIVHRLDGTTRKERLVHLDGAHREIVREGDEVVCIVMPGDDIAMLERSIPDGPFARSFVRRFENLSDSYQVVNMGDGRVAGRNAVRLSIEPLDAHRYGYRLWLDSQSSLLLRSEMIDKRDRRLEVFQFNHVVMGDSVAAQSLEPSEPQGSMVSHLSLKATETLAVTAPQQVPKWQLEWVPPGFRMSMEDVREDARAQSVSSMMYSDGLASFSIFVEPMPERGAATMTSQNGATVAITRGVMLADKRSRPDADYYLATLVGEIPSATGHQILDSLVAQ